MVPHHWLDSLQNLFYGTWRHHNTDLVVEEDVLFARPVFRSCYSSHRMQSPIDVGHLPLASYAGIGGRQYGLAAAVLFDVGIVGTDEVPPRRVWYVFYVGGQIPWVNHVIDGCGIDCHADLYGL